MELFSLSISWGTKLRHDTGETMLITLSTNKSIRETSSALEQAIAANKFGVLQVHDLQASMRDKGVDFPQACIIYEICNPHAAKSVLMQNMSISTALPCRISLYEENGRTYLTTLKPSKLLIMFGLPQLAEIAQNVEDTIIRIMDEAVAD